MKRLFAVALLAFLVAGCQDDVSEAVAPDDFTARAQKGGPGGSPDESALEGKINKLLNELFPQPEKSQANKLFADIKSALARGDTTEARRSVSDLLELGASIQLQDPKGPRSAAEGFSDLIDLLFEFVGLEPPEVDPALLQQDGDDGTVELALDGQDNLITTRDTFAGTFIEDEDIDQNLLIVLERLTTDEQDDLQGGECLPLPSSVEQREGCYQFDRFPEGTFQQDVRVGVCPEDAVENNAGFQLHEFEDEDDGGVEGVEALPNVAFPELQCADFTVVRGPDFPTPWRLAHSAWRQTGGRVLSWLSPATLQAIDSGTGGSTDDFSRIGWAEQMDVDIEDGDDQQTSVGSQVATDPQVKVTHLPEGDDDNPVEGASVTFTVIQGDGSVGSTSVTTGSGGLASTSWTLEEPGTHKLEASVARDAVVFSATATGPIFEANFDDESVGSLPQDPVIGAWSAINEFQGNIGVVSSKGSLQSQPVLLAGFGDISQGNTNLVGATVDTPTAGVYDVSWKMLGSSSSLGTFEVQDGDGDVIASVELADGGNRDIEVGGQDTGVDWSPGQHQNFELQIDLGDGEVSLSIDNSTTNIQGASFEESAADGIAAVKMEEVLGGSAAFDDIVIQLVP